MVSRRDFLEVVEKTGRILALDYGEKRIGVAVSDPMQIIAQGVTTIRYTSLDGAISTLRILVEKYGVSHAIVGSPKTMRGEIGQAALKTIAVVDILRKHFPFAIELFDERLTSVLAERVIKQLGKSPSKNKAKIDEIAATVLLQNYLDSKIGLLPSE